jgi:hypothetical protein
MSKICAIRISSFIRFGNGWLLDRRAFGAQMRQRAVDAGAVLRQPVRLVTLARPRDRRLRLEGKA